MHISIFDLFKIGIGPSSSHTVGPMRAAYQFAGSLSEAGQTGRLASLTIDLYGSLADTGRGHGTDKAVLLGLEGEMPESVDPETIDDRIAVIRKKRLLRLRGAKEIPFDDSKQLIFHRGKQLPFHPNGMRFTAWDADGKEIRAEEFYSVGGGFVVNEKMLAKGFPERAGDQAPCAFRSARDLLELCRTRNCTVSDILLAHEKTWRSQAEIENGLRHIWHTMQECVEKGCRRDGILPGGMKIKRRAPAIYRQLQSSDAQLASAAPLGTLDWVNLFALAVSEENAAGGRVVTAPTNGAAGIVPAVLHYYTRFCSGANEAGVIRFLLTAAAIAMLYKMNASISGAEVGCQGEVGVASSMAAGALTEVLGGSPAQVENAAEIGMEHNLGLTCDPIGGLVQVPCIERNAMGAVKAINASRIALRGDGTHFVSLDKVIKTMRQTGADMKSKYKETARGGLAVNVIEC
ncbi:MAG: L-serine ammonia-lyase [Methylohalobius sp. ZOD2]|nr:L-serine ammonia-lyase [Methylothermaceae bacterium]